MIESIMRYCRNFFAVKTVSGVWTIEDGQIDLPFIAEGQYFLIEGSVFNDGVHFYEADHMSLTDEEFTGMVYALAPPQAFLELVNEIDAWQQENGKASAYQSESFGGYSYQRAKTASGQDGGWVAAFGKRLSIWRKL